MDDSKYGTGGRGASLPPGRESRRPLGVCMYCPSKRGGHAWYVQELAAALCRVHGEREIHLTLVTSRDLEEEFRGGQYSIDAILPPQRPKAEFRFDVQWALSRVFHYVGRDRSLQRWVREHPDHGVVHLQEHWVWLSAWHVRRLRNMNRSVFATAHNLAPHTASLTILDRLSRHAQLRAWRRCDGLFVHTPRLAMELSKLLGPGHPPIEVTEHGVSASAAKLGATFDGDPQRLLFFGVLRPNKGLLVLLEAMRELPEFHLTIAGAPTDNEYLARIRKAISVLPEGRVELIPRFIPGSDIRGLFEANGTLLLPYTSFAAQSGVLSLAITYRTPVVVADTGALGETVSRFGLGEVVRPGDAADLARGVRQLLDPRRRSQCRAGLGVAGELLTWENMALATIRGYVRHSAAR